MLKHRRYVNIYKHLRRFGNENVKDFCTNLTEEPLAGEVSVRVEELRHRLWSESRGRFAVWSGHVRDTAASLPTARIRSS